MQTIATNISLISCNNSIGSFVQFFCSWVYNEILRTQKSRFRRIKKFAWFFHSFNIFVTKWQICLILIMDNNFLTIISLHFLEILSTIPQKKLCIIKISLSLLKIKITLENFHSHLIISLYFLKILSKKNSPYFL